MYSCQNTLHFSCLELKFDPILFVNSAKGDFLLKYWRLAGLCTDGKCEVIYLSVLIVISHHIFVCIFGVVVNPVAIFILYVANMLNIFPLQLVPGSPLA